MKFGIYAIKDELVGFGDLVVVPNDGVARRTFQEACTRSDSRLMVRPQDYNMYGLAVYDSDTGRIDPFDTPTFIVGASDFRKEIMGHVSDKI